MKDQRILFLALCLVTVFAFSSAGVSRAMVVDVPRDHNRDIASSTETDSSSSPDMMTDTDSDSIQKMTFKCRVAAEFRVSFIKDINLLFRKYNIKVDNQELLKDPGTEGVYNYEATLTGRLADFEALKKEFQHK